MTPGEIISQIILCKDYIDDWSTQKKITNQVLMGEGSPFLNLDNVKIAIDNSKNKDGFYCFSCQIHRRSEHQKKASTAKQKLFFFDAVDCVF